MFDQIVGIINGKLKKRRKSSMKGSQAKDATIGLLDIFGFEDMAINGFEQMFINLTNERIQHLFNSIMFDREVKLYESEGISPPFHFDTGNIECVKLFTSPSKPPGIVKLLGESTIMKNGRDGAALFLCSTLRSQAIGVTRWQTHKTCRETSR
jgi:myosin heavy subunit